nr:hypothetical protein [Tanacetum cinerariifolium]
MLQLRANTLGNTPGTSYSTAIDFGGVTDWYLEPRLAISSDNAHSAVTYTSISSNSDGPSWGIPLMNADELSKMDLYEEPEHLEYHVLSDDDIQVEDDDEDPEEDPNEEHEPEDED